MFTKKQIAALRYMIFIAKDGTDLSKRILSFLIEKSEKLTKEVCLTLVEDREGYTKEEISAAAYGVGAMLSANCTTHLDQILHVIGSEFLFFVHYGDFDPSRDKPFCSDGIFPGFPRNLTLSDGAVKEGLPLRYTWWLSNKPYSREATYVIATREELEKIDLDKSGLYDFK